MKRGDMVVDSLRQNDNSRESDTGEVPRSRVSCFESAPSSRRVRLGTENTPLPLLLSVSFSSPLFPQGKRVNMSNAHHLMEGGGTL